MVIGLLFDVGILIELIFCLLSLYFNRVYTKFKITFFGILVFKIVQNRFFALFFSLFVLSDVTLIPEHVESYVDPSWKLGSLTV